MSDSNSLIQSFVAVANCPPYLAEQYLGRNQNDLTAALEDYFATGGQSSNSYNDFENEHGVSTPRASRPVPGGGVRTLRDLLGHSDDEQKTAQNFFTGGEKSALQVENPDKNDRNKRAAPLVDDIMQHARDQQSMPDDRPSAQAQKSENQHTFTGTGFRLGDSSHSLEVIPDQETPSRPTRVTRQITFWREGFTVGDGPFRRYDDRENFQLLGELKKGRVPVSLLDVEIGQDVDVTVIRKVDQDYVPPKASQGGFHGQGQRLGSPVPGEALAVVDSAKSADEAIVSRDENPAESNGDFPIQIRFANGKRLSHKFNASDSIETVSNFVRNHPYNKNSSRDFFLSHVFPVKQIEASADETVESAQLKNAVIVQRWK